MESLHPFLNSLASAFDPRMYDLLAILLVLITALHGAFRGLIREAATMINIAMSYVLASPLGHLILFIPAVASLPSFLKKPLALTIGGILGYILTSITLAILIRTLGWNRKQWTGSMRTVIHGGGALIGGAFGFLLIMIISWYILWIGSLTSILLSPGNQTDSTTDAAENMKKELQELPATSVMNHREGIQESFIGNFAEKTMPVPEAVTDKTEKVMENVLELTQDPDRMQKIVQDASIQELLKSEAIQRLLNDNDISRMAREKDIMGLMAHPSLREALSDPEVAAKLSSIDIMKLLDMGNASSASSAVSSSSSSE